MCLVSIATTAPAAGRPQCNCEAGVAASQAAGVVCFNRTTQVMLGGGRGPPSMLLECHYLMTSPLLMTARSHPHARPCACTRCCIVGRSSLPCF